MNTKRRKIARDMFAKDIEKELKARGILGKELDEIGKATVVKGIKAVIKKYQDMPSYEDIVDTISVDPATRSLTAKVPPIMAKEIARMIKKNSDVRNRNN